MKKCLAEHDGQALHGVMHLLMCHIPLCHTLISLSHGAVRLADSLFETSKEGRRSIIIRRHKQDISVRVVKGRYKEMIEVLAQNQGTKLGKTDCIKEDSVGNDKMGAHTMRKQCEYEYHEAWP